MTTIFVSSGVTSGGVTVSSGNVLDVLSGGTVLGTHILGGGLEIVENGGFDSGSTVDSGGVLSVTDNALGTAGAVGDTVLLGGTAIAGVGGYMTSAIVRGVVLVNYAGVTVSDTVFVNGLIKVLSGGNAESTTISSGGALDISAGALSLDTVVLNGGTAQVQSGGVADRTFIRSGGLQFVSAGGTAQSTVISSGGEQIVSGTTIMETVLSGGIEFVDAGGIASGTVVSFGGTEIVASGGTALVLAGETIHGLEATGGRIIVSSGGTAVDPTIAGGRLELRVGASVQGTIFFDSDPAGVLRIDGTTMPTNTMSELAENDAFDLRDITLDPAGRATLGTGNVLQIHESGSTYSLNLDPTQSFAGRIFGLSGDGNGGTRVTEVGTTSDFNGDTRSDVLLHNVVSGSFVDWTMSSSAITAAQKLTYNGAAVALDSSWAVNGVGDFNGDGKSDILLHNSGNGSFVDWQMNGAVITGGANLTFLGSSIALDPSWSVAGTGDFNGDGRADILLRNSNGSFVGWAMNGSAVAAAGNLTFGGSPVLLDPSWSVAAVGDFDGDSRADILLRNSNGSFVDWMMSGSTITAADNVIFNGAGVSLDSSWQVLAAGDLNGGGKADILLRGSDGSFVDWQMNGAAITAASNLVFQGNLVKLDNSWTFADLADYNGDGRRDILLRNSTGSFVDWTMNGATITGAGSVTFQGNPVMLDGSWQTV